ncbi:MAG TPA: hypothetical protein PKW90_22860 [Myxococcota bacterium]|nr:hypothetical protein [Myxococcota bacterium]
MTDRPSIESLREKLELLADVLEAQQFNREGRVYLAFQAALTELAAYRERALVTRLLKGSAHTDLEAHDARVRREVWDAFVVIAGRRPLSIITDADGTMLLVGATLDVEPYRAAILGTDLEAHDARVRREALEEAWERMGHAPDPHDPGFFVCNHITVDRWYALRAAILGTDTTAPRTGEEETK